MADLGKDDLWWIIGVPLLNLVDLAATGVI